MAKKRIKKRKPRAVPPAAVSALTGIFGLTERVTTTRVRLTTDASLAFYSLCRLLASEHDDTRAGMLATMARDSSSGMARFEFHRHASSALRMVADRCLKTFSEPKLMMLEREARKEYVAAVERLSREHQRATKPADDRPVEPESY